MKENEVIELANSIFINWDERKIDPCLAYAALGYAYITFHEAVGKGKQEWLSITQEMAEIAYREDKK